MNKDSWYFGLLHNFVDSVCEIEGVEHVNGTFQAI